MILSIDLNPTLKRKYFLDQIDFNNINIPNNLIYGPGGEGIELAYLLNGINEDVLVSGFLGGLNGNMIHEILSNESISNEFLSIKDETSDQILISTNNNDLIIGSKGPRITRDELEGFLELYYRLLNKSSLVCCVGNLPLNVPKEIFYTLVAAGNKLNKKTLLAVKEEELKFGIDASPYLVLLDKTQLENLTRLKLDYEYEIIKAGLYILQKGCKIVVISLGNKGSIILTEENVYRVDVPEGEINCTTNFGYMLGGFAMAIERNYDFDMMLRIGHSCGMINCFKHSDNIDMSDIKRIMGEIEINKFNY